MKHPPTGGGPPFVIPEVSKIISDIFGGVDGQMFMGISTGVETSVTKHTRHAPGNGE